MTYPDNTLDYLIDLQLDLDFTKSRLEDANPESVPAILRSIEALEAEIKKYTEMLRK